MTRIELNITPRPKGRPRFDKNGHAYTDVLTRRFESSLRLMLRAQWKSEPLKSPIRANLTFLVGCPASRPARSRINHTHPAVRPDIDNFQKAVMDSANGILWVDDGQLVELRAIKLYDWATKRTGIVIEFEPMEAE